ncbi:MAG: peptidoglycan recognition family protein [Chloroflexota bacterium]|nr:N-acetylmuramoyl-L-alanine amidase [Chloroflexota bacterium]
MSESDLQDNNPLDPGDNSNLASGEGHSEDAPPFVPGLDGDPGSDQEEANNLEESTPVESDAFNAHVFEGQFEPNITSYQIIWQGSPNYWAGRGGNKIVAICDHIMQGSMESANSWFKNAASEVSAHFGVARDGRIYQWVRVENGAWTNGIMNRPDTSLPWLAEAIQKKINPNLLTIGIEHEGLTGQVFPEAQYQATLWLHRNLIQNYGIQPDRQHIIGHYQIDAVNRPGCPGTGFPWQRLLTDLGATQPKTTTLTSSSSSGGFLTGPVPGVVSGAFGPGTVNTNNAYVRSYPSFGAGVMVLRKLPAGTLLKFIAYTDQGAVYKGNSRWYLIDFTDKGGWIHSLMIS